MLPLATIRPLQLARAFLTAVWLIPLCGLTSAGERDPVLDAAPALVDFASLGIGEYADRVLTLTNSGQQAAHIDALVFVIPESAPGVQDFSIDIGGQVIAGPVASASEEVDFEIDPGAQALLTVSFAPTALAAHQFVISFEGNFGPLEVSVLGTGTEGAGDLHPEIDAELTLIVDYDVDGAERMRFFGGGSYTVEPGQQIASFEWAADGVVFSNEPNPVHTLPLGDTLIELTIEDDDIPPSSATAEHLFSVFPADRVPGALGYYYASRGNPVEFMDAVPARAQFIERLRGLFVYAQDGLIGASSFSSQVVVRIVANFQAATDATYEFSAVGGSGASIFVDDAPFEGQQPLRAGAHRIDVRFAVADVSETPLRVSATIDGELVTDFDNELTHDELGVLPTLEQMTPTGDYLGGDLITLIGFGYYPRDNVVVHWGDDVINAQNFARWTPDELQFVAPPGVGSLRVWVETPAGTSGTLPFSYSDIGEVPIDFVHPEGGTISVTKPTTADWGPDGRLYVGTITGHIRALTYDDDYSVIALESYTGVSNLGNPEIMGLAFNPYDAASPPRIWISHCKHFQSGLNTSYTGQVSVLIGPDFSAPEPIITNLPTSNWDHGMNGVAFDNNGDLFLTSGGNTNAGVASNALGGLPESPLSGAILKAETSRPDFQGALSYVESATGIENDSQGAGEQVDLAPGSHVTVHAPGLRNPYDLVFTTWGHLYCTDNGPNLGFGYASTGMTSDAGGVGPQFPDELVLVEYGNYYGHPNRSRARYDERQSIFRSNDAPSIPGEFSASIATLISSTDGICEYRADAFNGAMRGQLLVQKYRDRPRRVVLGDDRRSVSAVLDMYYDTQGLDIQTGPGGAIVVMDYFRNFVEVLVPNDSGAVGAVVYDIHPWRAPATGGHSFTIAGSGFGTLENTNVRIGGMPAQLVRVAPGRIEGTVPFHPNPPAYLVDVEVRVGTLTILHEDAFRYLLPEPGHEPGFWVNAATLPFSLGATASGVIGGRLLLFGQGQLGERTFAYDLLDDTWSSALAQRPHAGGHHAAVVVDETLYLIGGEGPAAGELQIYDSASDGWSLGEDLPWNGGAVAAALVNGQIIAAGGVVQGVLVGGVAQYDRAADTWSTSSSLPTPVSHASAGSDGELFYVIGGYDGTSDMPTDLVQVYDPETHTWTTSNDLGSDLQPLPGGRANAGRAVFFRGELYVFGGETGIAGDPGASPGGVYPQSFALDVQAGTWRAEAPLVTARQGFDPALFQSRIFLAGGGTQTGTAQSNVFEVFSRQ